MAKRLGILLLGVLLIGGLVLSNFNVALATSTEQEQYKFTKEDEKGFIHWYTQYGGDVKTAKKLIKKLNSGIIWDSVKGENYDNTTIEEIQVSPEETVQVLTFPDGSKYVSAIDLNPSSETESGSDFGIQSIGGGSISCGSGYCNHKNVLVYKETFLVDSYFEADYTIVNGGYDYISNVDNEHTKVLGGTVTNIRFGVKKTREDGNGYAYADYRFDVAWWGGFASSTHTLQLRVGNNKAWTYDNY